MLLESFVVVPRLLGLGGLSLMVLVDFGVEGDCLLGGRLPCLWGVTNCVLRLSALVETERVVLFVFKDAWSEFGSLSVGIHRSNQIQPQRGLFGSMKVWFAGLDVVLFLHVC